MSNPFESRICDSATLLHLCQQADKYEFNRRADTERLTNDIDLDGVHVIQCMVPYHRASFGPSREPLWPDHHRCYVFCKINGQTDPVHFFLDVEASKFDALMTEKQLEEARKDPVRSQLAMIHSGMKEGALDE